MLRHTHTHTDIAREQHSEIAFLPAQTHPNPDYILVLRSHSVKIYLIQFIIQVSLIDMVEQANKPPTHSFA